MAIAQNSRRMDRQSLVSGAKKWVKNGKIDNRDQLLFVVGPKKQTKLLINSSKLNEEDANNGGKSALKLFNSPTMLLNDLITFFFCSFSRVTKSPSRARIN